MEIRLFMPMLAVLATSVSWIGLCMFLFHVINLKWERDIPMRLHARGVSEVLLQRGESPVIVIREDDQVEYEGRICSTHSERVMPDLRKKIQAHLRKPNAAKIVVLVEAEARYERMIDVLNTFLGCSSTHYHMSVLAPFVGPRPYHLREPEALPEALLRMLKLGF